MYRKIVMHVQMDNSMSEADFSSSISESIEACGGKVVEIEDFRDSCYEAEDF